MMTQATDEKRIADLVARKWNQAISPGGFGAVIAHAGIGKTALLVQMALSEILQGRRVLHISLDDPLKKVDLWYQEMFRNFGGHTGSGGQWESFLGNRFIMIFKAAGFTVPRLEERLGELVLQKIFQPDLIIVDGLHFEASLRGTLEELQRLTVAHKLRAWFTVHSHRTEQPLANGLPPGFGPLAELFSLVWQIRQEEGGLALQSLQGEDLAEKLYLDPETMLLKK